MSNEILLMIIGVMFALFFATFMGMAVLIANTLKPKVKKEPTPPPRERTEEDERIRRAAQRLQKETMNMLTYNGDPQEEIHIDQVLMAHSH